MVTEMFIRRDIALIVSNDTKAFFSRCDNNVRAVHNAAIEQRRRYRWCRHDPNRWQATGPNQSAQLPELKQALPYLAETPAHMYQHALSNIDNAYKRWFKRLKARKGGKQPSFKKWYAYSTCVELYVPVGVKGRGICNNHLWIPNHGWVKFRSGKLPSGVLKSYSLKKRAGKWYASLLYEVADVKNPSSSIIGIDRGITHALALSDGTLIENPRFYRRAEAKLKRVQRQLSHKKKGSKRQQKAKLRLARAHKHVADTRHDWLHKQSTTVPCTAQWCLKTCRLVTW